MSADIEARSKVENDLAAAATAKGYKYIKSIDVMAPAFKDPQTPSKEEIVGPGGIFANEISICKDSFSAKPRRSMQLAFKLCIVLRNTLSHEL